MAWHPVAREDEIWPGEVFATWAGETPVLLVRVDDEVRAYVDRCAHQRLRVSGGTMNGYTLECPHHGWQYDLRTGAGINPVRALLQSFPLRIEAGLVLLDLDEVLP